MYTHSLVGDTLTPVRAYSAIRNAAGEGFSFLFESVVGGERWGRFSILGYRPKREVVLLPSGVWVDQTGAEIAARQADPLRTASAFLGGSPLGAASAAGHAERFVNAQVGYFAWDLVHSIDKVEGWGERIRAPLARFFSGATILVFDGLTQTLTIAAETRREVEEAREDLDRAPRPLPLGLPDRSRALRDVETDLTDEAFSERVRRAQEYIRAGDAFQVVLARTFTMPQRGRDPFDAYRAMRVLNPSPYMYFLDLPASAGEPSRTQIAGASPETMVRLEANTMTLRPIAGTRPRGKSEEEDDRLQRELLADPKERAEHVMLIDLARNDAGRVAKVGTVRLVRNMEVERFSHVMHIVSEVRAEVPPETPRVEVVRAAFPAGTLSGAPKVRAMQILRELESRPRGFYGGAVGYLGPNGDLDFAIAIRTAVCKNDRFEVTAGAGIVEGSVPLSEAEETRNKARGVLCAIEGL